MHSFETSWCLRQVSLTPLVQGQVLSKFRCFGVLPNAEEDSIDLTSVFYSCYLRSALNCSSAARDTCACLSTTESGAAAFLRSDRSSPKPRSSERIRDGD